jgi:hypothetical protein
MLKKLFFTAAAAAAVSVPLAGAAWATPSDNNPPGQGTTGPGIPHEAAAFGNAVDQANPGLPPLNPNGGPLPPGQFFKNVAKVPDMSTPEAAAVALNGIYGTYSGIPDVPGTPLNPTSTFDRLPPGMDIKSFTPACASGHTATDPNVNGGASVCH